MTLKSTNAKRWTGLVYLAVVFSFFSSFGYIPPVLPFTRTGAGVPALGELSRVNPPTSAMIALRTRQAEEKGKQFHPRHTWIPLTRISPALINAVIAAEDSTFYYHRGVEWGLTRDVLLESLRTGRRDRGASTLTQQVARNLYLSPKKSYLRKMREIVLAQRMEQTLPKKRILEIYLNIAEWGDGIFGAEAAAQKFYGKSAADLTWDEAAGLVAVLPSPRKHHPTDTGRWVTLRKEWVFRRLANTGRYIPPPSSTDLLPSMAPPTSVLPLEGGG